MGNNQIERIRYFIKVVQYGSFSKAAEHLGLPKSTLSKALRFLEEETGTTLLMRTTRSLTLTASGRVFFDSCSEPIQKLEEAQKSLYEQDSILSGLVRITAPEDLGNEIIAPSAARLCLAHPQLQFELYYTDKIIDLVRDGFDLAVRIGKLTESRLRAKRVGEISLSLVASPHYLKGKKRIKSPQDLESHDLLSMRAYAISGKWLLKSENESSTVKIKPRVICNQMSSLIQLAITHVGIALVPTFLCHRPVEEKKTGVCITGLASLGRPRLFSFSALNSVLGTFKNSI
jgi:LysR family transcriptional regulator, regulator for bpeEF and oprC